MTTLLTGATGFLGSAIARELMKDGRSLKLLVRENADTRNIDELGCEVIYGDLRDRKSLKSALVGCKTLYHAAAYYSLWSRDKKIIQQASLVHSYLTTTVFASNRYLHHHTGSNVTR